MNLSILNINQTNHYKNPNFEAKTIYKQLTSIPNVPCACCGKKVIPTDLISKAFKAVTRPLSVMMEKGFMNKWKKYPEIWNVLSKLAKIKPEQSLDKILESEYDSDSLRKGVVAILPKTVVKKPDEYEKNSFNQNVNNLFNDVLHRSRTKLKGSSTVMKKFAPFKKYLEGSKLEAFEQLQIYAQKYPRKTLSEIINMDEIYEFHRTKDLLQRAQVKEKREYHFNNIRNLVRKTNPEGMEAIEATIERNVDIYVGTTPWASRRKLVRDIYKETLASIGCEKIEKKVLNEVEQIPETYVTADSFFVHARNQEYDDAMILCSILSQSVSTFEHVIPRKENGADRIANGIVLCEKCNKERGHSHYNEFLEIHPEMIRNLTKQIKYIGDVILQDRMLPMYETWPIRITETLRKYTDKRLDIDVTKFTEKQLDKTEKRMKIRSEAIKTQERQRAANAVKRQELLAQIKELEKHSEELSEDIRALHADNSLDATKKSIYKKAIESKE